MKSIISELKYGEWGREGRGTQSKAMFWSDLELS